MLIPTSSVIDWRDLQVKVAAFFRDLGYDATVEEKLALRNGATAEVDVVVRDPSASVAKLYLIECKYWEEGIPRAAVQSFKMDVLESGANFGLFISKVGFQPGADIAAKSTNLSLLTFEGLQHTFGEEWFRVKREALYKKMQDIRTIHHLHFEQFNPVTIHNNMFFNQPGFGRRLALMHVWSTDLILAATVSCPKDYTGPIPIQVTGYPNDPARYEQENQANGTSYSSVRDFFNEVGRGMDRFVEAFQLLEKEAHDAFDNLEVETQDALLEKALQQFVEETPIRAFKDALGDAYVRLLSDHISKTRGQVAGRDASKDPGRRNA